MLVETKARVGVFAIALGAYYHSSHHWFLNLKDSLQILKRPYRTVSNW